MVLEGKDQWIKDPGTGEIQRYADTFSAVTDKDVARAEEVEGQIIDHTKSIEIHYLKLARALSTFNAEKLYLAKGYPTFRAWADSADIPGLSYRTAHNLIRIADEALPILEKHDAMNLLPPVSTMYDLLPILSDENAEEKFIEAAERVQGLTTRDAKQEIRAVRGIEEPYDQVKSSILKARVWRGEDKHRIELWIAAGDRYYQAGTVHIDKRDWPEVESVFDGNYEIVE